MKRTPARIVANPHNLSELIEVALGDFRSILNNPETYYPSYADWHWGLWTENRKDKRCRVCLAGAVMAGTLCVPPKELKIPNRFEREIEDSLRALNYVRVGGYADAYRLLFPERCMGGDEFIRKLSCIQKPRYERFLGFDEAWKFLNELTEITGHIKQIEGVQDAERIS